MSRLVWRSFKFVVRQAVVVCLTFIAVTRHICDNERRLRLEWRKSERDMGQTDVMRLVIAADMALGLSQRELGEKVGLSTRTISRWYTKRSRPGPDAIEKIARLIHAKDPVLAEKLMAAATEELASIGYPAPAPLVATTGRPPGVSKQLVDAVVYAACEAMDVSPRVGRPGVLAALRRAKELGVSMAELERELSPPLEPTNAKR